MKTALVTAALMLLASTSFAARNEMIDDALNKNLAERDQVTGVYHENDAAERPVLVEQRTKDSRLPVTLESELSVGSSRGLRNSDSMTRTYREKHVEAKLERELKDIDQAFEKESAAQAQSQPKEAPKSAVKMLLDSEG